MTDRPTRQQIKNRAANDRKKRRKLRHKLEARGVNPLVIDRIIGERRERDRAARHGWLPETPSREEILANTDDSLWPDDTGYEPSDTDPLLRGAARATGMTAKVVKRPNTITDWQYETEIVKGGGE